MTRVKRVLKQFHTDPPIASVGGGGGGANGEMANLTNEKGKFAIAIFRHFSPFFAIGSF